MEEKARHDTDGQPISVESEALTDEIVAVIIERYDNGPRETRFERTSAVIKSYGRDPRKYCVTRIVKTGLASN